MLWLRFYWQQQTSNLFSFTTGGYHPGRLANWPLAVRWLVGVLSKVLRSEACVACFCWMHPEAPGPGVIDDQWLFPVAAGKPSGLVRKQVPHWEAKGWVSLKRGWMLPVPSRRGAAPGSCLWMSSAAAIVVIWGMNQWVENLSLPLLLSH